MQTQHNGGWVIMLSFIVALMLTAMPLPDWALSWRPGWVAMVLIYCACVYHASISSPYPGLSAATAGYAGLFLLVVAGVVDALDTGFYGPSATALDFLDAGGDEYGVMAVDVYYSPGHSPPLPCVLKLNTVHV